MSSPSCSNCHGQQLPAKWCAEKQRRTGSGSGNHAITIHLGGALRDTIAQWTRSSGKSTHIEQNVPHGKIQDGNNAGSGVVLRDWKMRGALHRRLGDNLEELPSGRQSECGHAAPRARNTPPIRSSIVQRQKEMGERQRRSLCQCPPNTWIQKTRLEVSRQIRKEMSRALHIHSASQKIAAVRGAGKAIHRGWPPSLKTQQPIDVDTGDQPLMEVDQPPTSSASLHTHLTNATTCTSSDDITRCRCCCRVRRSHKANGPAR